jgi:formylglycine-generating enzyme required for sulfatase activity
MVFALLLVLPFSTGCEIIWGLKHDTVADGPSDPDSSEKATALGGGDATSDSGDSSSELEEAQTDSTGSTPQDANTDPSESESGDALGNTGPEGDVDSSTPGDVASNDPDASAGDANVTSDERDDGNAEAPDQDSPDADAANDSSSDANPSDGAGIDTGIIPPSCQQLSVLCGDGDSCCKSLEIPGAFYILAANDTPGNQGSATVPTFLLDKYEVTTGRFQAFVDDYDNWHGSPEGGPSQAAIALANARGWQPDFDDKLPATADALRATATNRDASGTTDCTNWTFTRLETLPMNCVSWYEAFAFCIWDGGRLPTEAEWEYAAVGGTQYNFPYPWGNDSPTGRAVYGHFGDGNPDTESIYDILPVGTYPLGAARWGQLDMMGSVFEWMLDYFGPYPQQDCNDCANLTGSNRVFRGGSWYTDLGYFNVIRRDYIDYSYSPLLRTQEIGVRCARDLPVVDP